MDPSDGVCVIIPRDQDHFRPCVLGMGILVDARTVVTCAHVVNDALGKEWGDSRDKAVVKVCFPFAESPLDGSLPLCIEGEVDRTRCHPPRNEGNPIKPDQGPPGFTSISDFAVILLDPGHARLPKPAVIEPYLDNAEVKLYGFRGSYQEDGSWRSHPDGQYAQGQISGPTPGGRFEFVRLLSTGTPVQKGYSGAGVYDISRKVVVGMVVESDRDKSLPSSRCISGASLLRALGREVSTKGDDTGGSGERGSKPSVAVDGSTTGPTTFDPRTEDVKEAIRTKLDMIKDCKILDENGREVGILSLVSQELVCSAPQPGKNLSDHIAAFLTNERDDTHLGKLVWRVFDLLCKRGKKEEAQRIGEVVDLMLPLCLPQDILSRAWRQLQDHGAVLIQNAVARRTGAEILVAGLFKKPTKFRSCSPEPTGEQLVPIEGVPIGDPELNVESALSDLFIATFHADVKEGGKSKSIDSKLTARQMREDLIGLYRSRRLGYQRPSYCAVELAANEEDRENQSALLSKLAIPDLLFIGLRPDSETRAFESFVIDCLNTRFKSQDRG